MTDEHRQGVVVDRVTGARPRSIPTLRGTYEVTLCASSRLLAGFRGLGWEGRRFRKPATNRQLTARIGRDDVRVSVRIMVVEDEENVAYVVSTALRLADFEVVECRTARQALHHMAEVQPPDIIILDVMLPDLDGFEMCRRMRLDRISTPVIFLTARDGVEDRVHGLTIGGDDYLTKPFSVEELVARVQAILRRLVEVPTPVQGAMRCGDLKLDDDAHVVTRQGQVVRLSPTEYKLLRYLLRNAGRVVTKEQILDHVWDYDFDGESTVVETFVSSLRKKVDVDDPRLIHTVRGVGYRLDQR